MATLVENVSSSLDEYAFSLTRDEKTGFIGRNTGKSPDTLAIVASRRSSAASPFGGPDDHLTLAINAGGNAISGSASVDGLIFYFHRQNLQMLEDIRIFAAARADATGGFDGGAQVTVDGTALTGGIGPKISIDGRTLYWLDFTNGAYGRVFAAASGASFKEFVGKRPVSTMSLGSEPVLSADELTLYYSLDNSSKDVFVTTRADKADVFAAGIPVANVNSAADDSPVAVTNDDCILYIVSRRAGGIRGYDIWEARRPR